MKKLISLILIVVVAFGGLTAFAADAATMKITNVTANPGDTVDISVDVLGNPGFAAMNIVMEYDSDSLELLSAKGGDVVNGVGIISNMQQGGDLSKYNPLTLFVVNPSDFKGDGSVFIVSFRVKATAKTSKIQVFYDEESIANQNLEDVDFEIAQGKLIIPGTTQAEEEDSPIIVVDPEEETKDVQTDYPSEIPETEKPKEEIKEDSPSSKPAEKPEENKETGKTEEKPVVNNDKKEITVTIDGKNVIFDQPPILVNDRTLVPMRAIFETLGAKVDWDDSTKTAIGVKDGVTVKIQINNNILMKNEEKITLDVPAQLINARTLVPIRAISESFGCKVDWEDATKTVIIKTK